jgi:pimeloyl-ACP methyl ester carboxylesterase
MPNVHANGIDIQYEFVGSGPTLALSHGWLGPTDCWPPGVLDALAEHLRLLLYDVRGHGSTSAPDDPDAYSMPIYAQDLRSLLDALEIEQAHIGGVSQGGMISAQFAVDFPERTRSLLICDSTAGNGHDDGPGGQWEHDLQTFLEVMERVAADEGLAELAERRIQGSRNRDPHYNEHPMPAEERERTERDRLTRMSLSAFRNTSRALRLRPDLTERIRGVRVPALVLAGEWDDFLPCGERDHRLIDGSRYVLVKRCGHASPEWRTDAFVRAVTEFIADVEAGREVAGELEL